MSEQGKLGPGTLAKLLLQLQTGYQTGVLTLEGGSSEDKRQLFVVLRQGRVLQVDSPTRDERWRLGTLLTRGGYLSRSDLSTAIEGAQTENRPLGSWLLEKKQIDKQHLAELLHAQFMEDLHEALRWQSGAWSFQERDVKKRRAAPKAITLSEVLQTSEKQMATWDALMEWVPSDEATFSKTHEGPVTSDIAGPAGLGRTELLIFSLVHHKRDVLTLAALARRERFIIYHALALLRQANLIELRDAGQSRRIPQVDARKLGRGLVNHATTALLIAAALLLGVWMFLENRTQPNTNEEDLVVEELDPWQEALTQAQLQRIRNALGTYKARHGDYPVRLPLLVEEGLLANDDMTFPDFERPYVYRSTEEDFVLVRPKR